MSRIGAIRLSPFVAPFNNVDDIQSNLKKSVPRTDDTDLTHVVVRATLVVDLEDTLYKELIDIEGRQGHLSTKGR